MVIARVPARALRPVLAAALALAAIGGFGAAPASAQPLVTGLSGVYEYNPTAYAHVRATGAEFVRIGVPWAAIAPRQQPAQWQPENPGDPNYSWGFVDGAVKDAVAAGLTPVLMVSTAPAWADRCPPPAIFPEAVCDPDPAALAKFATAVARRFSGSFDGLPRVRYWQGLNEPNLSLYFDPQYEGSKLVSPQLYRQLINAFYAAIKAVDPSNLVLVAGLGPIAVPKYTIGPLAFARQLLCMTGSRKPRPAAGNCEGGLHFDIFDVHPYTTGGPTHEGGSNDVELGDLPKLIALLGAADRAGRIHGAYRRTPLWVTEFSWDTKPPDPGGLEMKIAARWVAEALYQVWHDGIEHFFWYGLRDEPLGPGSSYKSTAQSGLYFRGPSVGEDQPKKTFYAFRFPFVAYQSGRSLSFWGRTPTSSGGKVTIQILRGGRWLTVRSTTADGDGIFAGHLATGYGANLKGAARARFGGVASVPFSMRPVKDFYQPPFG